VQSLVGCQADVKAVVGESVAYLSEAGAVVEEVSIPLHTSGTARAAGSGHGTCEAVMFWWSSAGFNIWLPMCLEGGHATRMEGAGRGPASESLLTNPLRLHVRSFAGLNWDSLSSGGLWCAGVGMHFKGQYPVSMQQAYARGFKCHAAELSFTNKFYVLFGEYIREVGPAHNPAGMRGKTLCLTRVVRSPLCLFQTYGHTYYAKCQNLARTLTHAYDEALAKYDVLITPTIPITATKLLEEDASPAGTLGGSPPHPPIRRLMYDLCRWQSTSGGRGACCRTRRPST
jgi:hypothetical protein